MGEVWRGRHVQLGHSVAVKILKADAASDQGLLARFRREARIAAQLRSRHIVRVEDFGVTRDGRPYLIMEFLEGESLARRIERSPRGDWSFVAHAVRQIAAACDVAHAAGIVHRDLKPDNCFVVRDEDGSPLVKVLDFGVAKVTDNVFVTRGGVVTGAHVLLGTPVYMSPEQTRGEPDIDGRSDLWSLGVIAFEMLTGRIPYEATSVVQVLYAVLAAQIPAPSAIEPGLPPTVDAWMTRALHPDRAQRFNSGRELAAALEASLVPGPARSHAPRPSLDATAFDRTVALPSISPPSVAPPSFAPSLPPSLQAAATVYSTIADPAPAAMSQRLASPEPPAPATIPLPQTQAPLPAAPWAVSAARTWSGPGGAPIAYPSAPSHPSESIATPRDIPARGRGPHLMGGVFLVLGVAASLGLGLVIQRARRAPRTEAPPASIAPLALDDRALRDGWAATGPSVSAVGAQARDPESSIALVDAGHVRPPRERPTPLPTLAPPHRGQPAPSERPARPHAPSADPEPAVLRPTDPRPVQPLQTERSFHQL